MNLILVALTGAAGVLNSVQSGCNAALGKAIGPFAAGLTSVLVTWIVILIAAIGTGRLQLGEIASAPWWAWVGGICGGVLILAQLFAAEQLGSAVFIAILVTTSVATSLALDHFGLVGFKQHAASWPRLAGAALMFAGLVLIAKF